MTQATEPRIVVVAGGTGNIGEGIVRSALSAGANVVVPSRSLQRLEALKRYTAQAGVATTNLHTIQADVGNFDGARHFVYGVAAQYGPIDLTVASLGSWRSGPPLIETSASDYRRALNDNLDAHYAFARHVLLAMRVQQRGVHVLIGWADQVLFDRRFPLSTIAGHAQLAMAQILDTEARTFNARTYQLFVAGILDRHHAAATGQAVVTPDEIGVRLLELYRTRPDERIQKLFAQPVPGFPP